jgi:hypothetical protein
MIKKTQIQVLYRKRPEDQNQETEILTFGCPVAAQTFLNSILKNPDVESAKKL